MNMILIDLLFPPRCVLCRVFLPVGTLSLLCERCAGEVRTQYRHSAPFTLAHTNDARAALWYDKRVRYAMQAYKFEHHRGFYRFFEQETARELETVIEIWRPDVITYVPISFWRMHTRGFNQCALVARGLSRRFGIRCVPMLYKRFFVKKQSKITEHTARWDNAARAFRIRHSAIAQGERVVLIDDIVTTGATMVACAALLREAGATQVFALAMTHVPKHRNADSTK